MAVKGVVESELEGGARGGGNLGMGFPLLYCWVQSQWSHSGGQGCHIA